MDTSDQFESQLKEILDSGPDQQPREADALSSRSAATTSTDTKTTGTRYEILLRIIGLIAVVILLLGFALRIALF